MPEKIPRVNVDIIVERNGKILLGRLKKEWAKELYPSYGLPGTDILFGETFEQAVRKQLKEQLDLELARVKIISVNANFALGNHYIGIGILAEAKGEPKNLRPNEWEGWEWISKDKIPENLFPAAKNQVECYLKGKVTVSR